MQGGQSFNILDEGRRNEVAGKVEIFNCTEEIFYSCDEHLCCIRWGWGNIGLGKPCDSVSDAWGGRCSDKDVMSAVMGKCGS